MKRGLFSTLCFVAASVVNSASAADLPVKARIAPLPPVFSWTGCYFGVNAGGVWGSASDNWTANPLPGAFNGPAFISAHRPGRPELQVRLGPLRLRREGQ